jgi:HEPN domain-containing protein
MKPDPVVTAKRWLRQAEHDLTAGERDFQAADYSESCYHAEQASQKALKGFLFLTGERRVVEHSVFVLATRCKERNASFEPVVEPGRILDQYYVGTRYPDAVLEPAAPFELYSRDQARQALDTAGRIIQISRSQLPG